MTNTTRLLGTALAALACGVAMAQDPTIDGTKDASYTASAVQNTQTGWGDNNLGQVGPANGSELDNVHYKRTGTDLFLFVGGNIENAPGVYQKCAIFIDTGSGGYNKLPAGLPDIDFNRLIRFGDDGSGNGLKFDGVFNAAQFIGVVCGGNSEIYVNYSQIETVANGGVGYYVGAGTCGSDGSLSGGNNPNGVMCTINNSNVAGVPGGIGQDPGNGAGVNTGIEIKIPLAQLGNPAGNLRVCVFIYSDGYDFVSNQVLGGIGGGDNLGEPRVINFDAIGGDQYITVPASTSTETLAPNAEQILLGTGTAGNLASWAADDSDARRIKKFFVPNQASPFIRANLSYTTTKNSPTAIDLKVKVKAVEAGAFKVRGFLQNKVNSSFVQVLADTTINLGYQTFTGSASGTLADYVGSGGAMTGRLEIQQTGPSTALLPSTDFEFCQMVVTG